MKKERNPKQLQKSSRISMQYATPTRTDSNYQTESKSYKNFRYERRLVSNELEGKHPNISGNLYQKLEAPTDLSDAQIKMQCYQQTMKDIELQIEANELETSMLCNGDDILPGNADKVEELEAKKLKLLNSKRFHQNAANCYWYWIARHEN